MSGCQAPPVNAPAARRRAAFWRGSTPLPVLDRADSGPLAAFSSLRSVGMAGRPIPPSLQSEKRTQRPKLVAIAKPPLRCGFAGPRTVLQRPRSAWRLRRPWRCCYGPLLRPAIRGHLARASAHHMTTSHGPRDEALRNSATPTVGSGRRPCSAGVSPACAAGAAAPQDTPDRFDLVVQASRVLGGKSEIRNPKSEIRNHAARVTIPPCHVS